MADTVQLGLVAGRFQPIHRGHMEFLLAALDRCRHLIVGITNPDPSLTVPTAADLNRGTPESNPLTYYQRQLMVETALTSEGVSRERLTVVPFPINRPELLHNYADTSATVFTTVYDEWGREKLSVLREVFAEVIVMWERTLESRLTSGTEVRQKMRAREPWEHLVPPGVVLLLSGWLAAGAFE